MTYLAVLPVIDTRHAAACIKTARCADLLVVDNSTVNRGVAAAWNDGRALAIGRGVDWLVLVSESVRFGRRGLATFTDRLGDYPDAVGVGTLDLGWKLLALRVSMLAAVGPFDEVFHPAYWEDTDYLYRMGLAGFDSPRENDRGWSYVAGTNVRRGMIARALRIGLIPAGTLLANQRRYEAKWGGGQGTERWTHPYDDPTLDWTHTGGVPSCTSR